MRILSVLAIIAATAMPAVASVDIQTSQDQAQIVEKKITHGIGAKKGILKQLHDRNR